MNDDIIRPLMISEKLPPSEVRRYSRKLGEELAEQVAQELANNSGVLFVFILRGAMLLYPPFAVKFERASFTFVSSGTFTETDCKDYDTVVIVDTVVDTGKTVTTTKKLLTDFGISAKRWFCVCVFAKDSVKAKISECFDAFFCLAFPEEFSMYIDAGQYAACGDGAQIQRL